MKKTKTGLPPEAKKLLLEAATRAARLSPQWKLEQLFYGLMLLLVVSPPGVSPRDPIFKRIRRLDALNAAAKKSRRPKRSPSFPVPAGAPPLNSATVKSIISDEKAHEPTFTEYLLSIPPGPDVFDRIRDFRARRKPLPKGESAKKLIKSGRRI